MLKGLVSIIVPVYNCEAYIRRCIESILRQTYRNVEVILINDGSTDQSENICREYQKQDKRIRLYNQENQGVSVSRNYGLSVAEGEFIQFVDGDDSILDNMTQELVKCIQEQETDMVV